MQSSGHLGCLGQRADAAWWAWADGGLPWTLVTRSARLLERVLFGVDVVTVTGTEEVKRLLPGIA